ncbi:MAG: hypothetical protein K6B54_05060 [Clostridia bacterium]|nr:hypothetical protein [Clostridia bacterium]
MNKKKVLCAVLGCIVFLATLSSCTPKSEKKYEVLFAGSSDSASALLIPLDFEEIEYDTKTRDTDLWPDEMIIQYEGKTYNCSFDYCGESGSVYSFELDSTGYGKFVLNLNGDIIGYNYNNRLSEEEIKNIEPINENEAIEIAEQIFRKNFDVDYSQYEMTVERDESLPTIHYYKIKFKRKYNNPQIELSDELLVNVGYYGNYISFIGTIGRVTPPIEEPNVDEIKQSVEERLRELLKEQRISYSDFEVNYKYMILSFYPKWNKYCVDCYLTYDCKGTVDGIEKEFHDYIEVIVVCNDLK